MGKRIQAPSSLCLPLAGPSLQAGTWRGAGAGDIHAGVLGLGGQTSRTTSEEGRYTEE